MNNSDEPPAKRLKIGEEENINVKVDVLDEEEEEMEEENVHFDNNVLGDEDIFFDAYVNEEEELEEEEDREEEIVNGFNFNNVSAQEGIEFLMALLHLQNYEQLFHVLEEAMEEEEEEAEE